MDGWLLPMLYIPFSRLSTGSLLQYKVGAIQAASEAGVNFQGKETPVDELKTLPLILCWDRRTLIRIMISVCSFVCPQFR